MTGLHCQTFVLVAAPLALGAVHQIPLLLFTTIATWGLALAIRNEPAASLPRVTYVLLVLAALMLLQALPLPDTIVTALVPVSAELRAFALDGLPGQRSAWSSLSLAPAESCLAAVRVLASVAVLCTAYLVTRATGGLGGVARAIGFAHGAVLVVLLCHQVLGLTRAYGLFALSGRFPGVVSEPFLNPNHLATFLLLTTPVMTALALSALGPRNRAVGTIAVALGLVALLSTGSRASVGGLVTALLAALALIALRPPKGSLATWGRAVVIGVGVLLGALAIAKVKTKGILLSLVKPRNILDFDDRSAAWQEGLHILRDAPILGTAPGSFVDLHFFYRQDSVETLSYRFVENSVLQLFIDMGWAGGSLTLAFLAMTLLPRLWRSVRSHSRRSLETAFLVSLITLALPTVVGFPFTIPGIALPASAILGGLLALHANTDRSVPTTSPRRSGIWLAVVVLGVVVSVAVIAAPNSREASEGRLRQVLAGTETTSEQISQAIAIAARHPADPWAWLDIGLALIPHRPAEAMPFINRAMYLAPASPEPHKATAQVLLRLGRPEQALAEYGLALERTHLRHNLTNFRALVDTMIANEPSPALLCRAAPRSPPQAASFAVKLLSTDYRNCGIQLLRRLHQEDHPETQITRYLAQALLTDRAWEEAHAVASTLATDEGALLQGRALLAMDRGDEAELLLARAARAKSVNTRRQAVAQLGRLLVDSQRAEAIAQLVREERARADSDPRMLALCLHLEALVAEQAGRPSAALKLWQRARDLDRTNPSYEQAVKRIETNQL